MLFSSWPLILIGFGILLLLWWRGEHCARRDAQHGPAAADADREKGFELHRHGGNGCC
jgi:hypothetical protein